MEKFLVSCWKLRISASRENSWRPQVRACWSSTGPGGGQVKCLLDDIATSKNKGITGDHVAFFFVSRRIQPLQRWKHPTFRYEGVKDPTRLYPEAMSRAEVVKRCCKILDHLDNALVLPALFSAVNPPENTWVSVKKYCRVLARNPFNILMNPIL